MNTVGKLAWHVHHERLCEFLTEPIESRQLYIKEQKPASEHNLRLKLLKIVKGRLPKGLQEAYQKRQESYQKWQKTYQKWQKTYQKWQEANQKRQEANQKWQKANQKWQKALVAAMPAMEKLHKKECPGCPWDGKTIFPKEAE